MTSPDKALAEAPVNLAEGLALEISRVSRIHERWKRMMLDHPEMASGMGIGAALMQAELETAFKAAGDIEAMMASYQSLKDYSDD